MWNVTFVDIFGLVDLGLEGHIWPDGVTFFFFLLLIDCDLIGSLGGELLPSRV